MDFELNENHKMIRDMVKDFVAKEVIPNAGKWDETEEFPHEVVKKLGGLGIMGMVVPEKYGGSGLDHISASLALEEIARGDGSLALTVESHNYLATAHICLAGNEEQKKKYLPELASARMLGAWCLTEPCSGSDSSAMKTRAKKVGDKWIINGSKMFITQGTVAGVYVVLTSTNPEKKQKGITSFIVDKDTKGLKIGKKIHKLGVRSSDTAEIFFEDMEVFDFQRLGEVDMGFIDTMKILDGGRVGVASMAVGIARGAFEEALKYSQERVQFGKRLCDFQAIQWMLSDMATQIEAGRLLTHRAAYLLDKGIRASREASMAKLFASEMATQICLKSIQIHGGYGFTRDFSVERYLRDAKLCEIGEGTSEVQRIVIARSYLK